VDEKCEDEYVIENMEREIGQFQSNCQYSSSHLSEQRRCPDTDLDVNMQTDRN
jgi:hypothetical protein